jgi:Pretoxin HINT domain
VRLEMDAFGVTYEMAFTRSLDWIRQTRAAVGGDIDLVMPEMGLDGKARVVGIDPCPPIERDDGTGRMIVTGTMKHLASNVLSLEIAGQTEPLGVTDTHPIWSEDRHAFIVAGQLREGEHLKHLDGTLTEVTRITPRRGPPVMVYNLEVDAEHVYHVTPNGLLVHNNCGFASMMSPEEANRYNEFWGRNHPSVSSPYDIKTSFTKRGQIKTVTTYDQHGRAHRQYGLNEGHPEHQHRYEYPLTARPGTGSLPIRLPGEPISD